MKLQQRILSAYYTQTTPPRPILLLKQPEEVSVMETIFNIQDFVSVSL